MTRYRRLQRSKTLDQYLVVEKRLKGNLTEDERDTYIWQDICLRRDMDIEEWRIADSPHLLRWYKRTLAKWGKPTQEKKDD